MVHPDEYADIRSALDYAELALGAGDGEEALSLAEQVILRIDGRSPDDLLPAARLTMALALLSAGKMREAIEALEGIVADRDAALHWARAAMTLTWCYREAGELQRAIDIGEQISHELRDAGLDETDDALKLRVTLAFAYFAQGDVRHAKRICKRAIEIADRTGSLEAQASAYWNTSLFESHDGAVEAAIPLAEQAISLFEAVDNHSYAAQLRGLLGILLLRRDPPDVAAAIPTLERSAQELAWSRASPINIADVQVWLARALFLSGDVRAAEDLLETTLQSSAAEAPFLKVSGLVLRGQIQARLGLVAAARDTYRSAVFELTAVGADRQAAQLWFELGSLLHELGETDDARDAFKSAAVTSGLMRRHRPGFLTSG